MNGVNVFDQPSESTAQAIRTVFPTLGFPNNRQEQSPIPTGWLGLDTKNIVNVSRETLAEDSA
jgi:hypothetical protein